MNLIAHLAHVAVLTDTESGLLVFAAVALQCTGLGVDCRDYCP